ncbi:hypothetical protein ACEPAF_2220 [Sanghuangporus sanghuang]
MKVAETGLRTTKVDEELLGSDTSGYYPVTAGSTITGDEGETFEAVRKLGWGVNSTVWVGRDCAIEPFPKYVALKTLNRYATHEHDESSGKKTSELEILLRTYNGKEPDHRPPKLLYNEQGLASPPHPGWFRVSGYLDAFPCENSQHLVIVFPLYGENMKEFMRGEPDKRLTAPLAKKVAKDTLLALDYLHSHCAVIHCDVKPENILVDFNIGYDLDDIFEAIMKMEPNAGRDGCAASLWFPHHRIKENFRVVLADFSHASWNDLFERSPSTVGSAALRAPELILGFAYDTAIDIWAFACTIFELLTGKPLFRFPDSRSPNELSEEPRYHLSLMQALVGEPYFPTAREGSYLARYDFIDSNGWIKSSTSGSTLNELVSKDVPDDVGDKDKFAAFLRRCLSLDPRQRASASELLNDPWLVAD